MFRNLKDRLKLFKDKAAKELEEVEEEVVKKEPSKKTRPPKKKERKKDKKTIKGKSQKAKRITKDEQEVFSEGRSGKKLREGRLEDLLWDLEMALLESDVALPVVEKIKVNMKKDLMGRKVKRGIDMGEAVEASLKNAIIDVLAQNPVNFDDFVKSHKKPVMCKRNGKDYGHCKDCPQVAEKENILRSCSCRYIPSRCH
jgi:fused signal recognition particle receptor